MTLLGMFILLFGLLLIFIGQLLPSLQNKGIFSALWIFGGIFIGIGSNPAKGAPNGSPIMVAIGFICTFVGLLMLLIPLLAKKSLNPRLKITLVVIFGVLIIGAILKTCNSSIDSSQSYSSSSDSCRICERKTDLVEGFGMCYDCYVGFTDWQDDYYS